MRLRRAVLKIPPKSSVPPRSPLYKLRHLLTLSESTLPQVLIPLHFKSFISNTYKKPGGGTPLPAPKFVNSSLRTRLPSGHPQTPITSIPSFTSAHLPSPMGGTTVPQRRRCTAPLLHGSPTCHAEGIEGSAVLFGPLGPRDTGHGNGPLLTAHYSIRDPSTFNFRLFPSTTHYQLTAPPYSRTDNDSQPP